jgi:type IV pilus assembly protein PilZ
VKDEAASDPPDRDSRNDAEDASAEPPSSGLERRRNDRFDVTWQVDCETEDTFLYAYITNISEMGIFVKTDKPLPVGTQLVLRFAPPTAEESFVLNGIVQWINPVRPLGENLNPGMGIRFQSLDLPDRERIVEAVRTIAYVRQSEKN